MANSDYVMSLDVIGAQELVEKLESAGGVGLQALSYALNQTVNDLVQAGMAKAPHKSGTLKSSLPANAPFSATEDSTPEYLFARVGTNVEYARAQELGTVRMTIHSHSKSGKAFSYKGNIKPKYYMRDAMKDTAPKMSEHLAAAAQKIINHITEK